MALLAFIVALIGMPHPAAAQATTPEARRADLAQFRSEFLARDRAYTALARRAAEQRLDRLEARAVEIDATAFALELARIVALADNGHTLSYAGPRAAKTNRVAIRMAPFGTDFHVLHARAAQADLLGARLLAIDGRPLAQLREAGRSLSGGLDAWRDRRTPLLLESPQQLHALGLAQRPDAAVYRFVTTDGRVVERRLAAEPAGVRRPHADTARLLLPETVPAELDGADSGWRPLLPPARAPWALQEADQPLRWRAAPELAALVIEMRQTIDAPNAKLATFFEAVRQAVRTHAPTHLLLDLRLNSGGDLTQARDFAESLPQLVPGRIFVLTSPWTFSAAISITGYLKQAAPARVSIVGEPVGDRLEFFAEGRMVSLRHSGEVLLFATERHDYADGCRQFSDCHEPVRRRPIAVPDLAPDIDAPWTLEAYRRGADPALEAVAAALRQP